jgi:integrase
VTFLRSDFTPRDEFRHLLAALTPSNRLALETSLATGLRISDVLNLKTSDLKERFSIKELKTGKKKSVRIPKVLLFRLKSISGRFFVFEHRFTHLKHKTRQAVYKDLKRVCHIFKIKNLQLSPHSARKIYAVLEYQKTHDLKKVCSLLNHDSEAVTMLYAMADNMVNRYAPKIKKGDEVHKVTSSLV